MDIYVEYVLIDNFIIDYLLLYYTNKLLAFKQSKKWKLLIGAAVGALASIVFPLIKVIPFVAYLMKFALSCVLVLFLGHNKSFRQFVNKILTFYLLTFALGGISFALLSLIDAKFINGVYAYDAVVPLGVILATIFIYIKIIEYLAHQLYKKRNIEPFLKDVILIISNKQIKVRALLDSGNGLIDKKTGLPVVIIALTSLMRVYKLSDIQKAIETGKSDKLKNVRFINYSTVAGTSKKMLLFDADEMIIINNQKEERIVNFTMGLSMHEFKSKDNFEILLNPAVL